MSALDVLHGVVAAFDGLVLVYLVLLNLSYTGLLVLGWSGISSFVRRRRLRDYEVIGRSDLSVPVSILVPAYNERPVIVESVRALLGTHYPHAEVVVVCDGPTDGTLEELIAAFRLVDVSRVPRARLETRPVRRVLVSPLDDRLTVIDKENGGKADALNVGLSYARYPLFCAVDADTMLDRDALPRLVWHFQTHPETVACGGIVRIVNGSTVEDSRVTRERTPRSMLVNLQIVEYLRAFLVGRTGWSRLGMLVIISGAFGVFRRQAVIDAGGYDTTTVGEDVELVVRLHRHLRDRGEPYRVAFVADPVCWTEAPTDLRTLARQRDRWQRGLLETVIRHRGMIGRPRYGRLGLVALPYFVLFELIGPIVELVAYPVMVASLALGWASAGAALTFVCLAFTFGLVLSFGALRIEERAFQRYARWRCLGRLVLALVVENFGYRQWNTFLRVKAYWTFARGRTGWGAMVRIGYEIELPRPELLVPGAVLADPDSDSARDEQLVPAPVADVALKG
ncbi:MAG: glycosyltransferase [Thermoleophilaceae bacterium]|nr:glycosyltransferase [Thermoleophilaceae bacterium]